MKKFKIFYSWQSDLPGSKTRNFLRECIDEAIDLALETEAFEAERDEATTGTTGSPNIVATLFSKIDDCDLFIADLSLCFTEDQGKGKRSPNPNVLLELGYAVKTLGWERVICLCNTDFGDKYPFDIAHNRITDFSLEGKSKKEVKGEIAKIIFINIRDLRKHTPRAKAGIATHIIGTYNTGSHEVTSVLTPLEIGKQEGYVLHNEELLNNARKLLAEVQELTNRIETLNMEDDKCREALPELPDKFQFHLANAVHLMADSYKGAKTPVVWREIEEDKSRIKRWLGTDVSDNLFDLGGLTQMTQLFDVHNSVLDGTNEEKVKYEKLQLLSYELLQLDIRRNYLKTFEGMIFIPLAIQNISAMEDKNIRVVVSVESGEIVEPDEHLIWNEYEGMQGLLCRDDEDKADVGIICELFCLNEDGFIQAEDIPYDPTRYIPKGSIITAYGLSQSEKTEEDYKRELNEFIASTGGRGYYEFNVASLRPGECRWLCCGMLVRPIEGNVKIHYQIFSAHSTGELNGILDIATN